MIESTNIFLFAHQDDESGVFYEIHRLVNSGQNVIVIYLTSGSSTGRPAPSRDLESISVLEEIGVHKKNIYFLGREEGIPDGGLSKYLEIAFQSVLALFNKIDPPRCLYFLAWEGGHQDHDAVHLIGLALGSRLDMLNNCYQFPLYTGKSLPSIFFKLFFPFSENGQILLSRIPWRQRLKFTLYCLSYPSQKKTWIGLLPFFVFHYIFRGTQILQPVSAARAMQKPHSGVLLYERRGAYSQNAFIQDTNNFCRLRIFQSDRVDKCDY